MSARIPGGSRGTVASVPELAGASATAGAAKPDAGLPTRNDGDEDA